jgi:ABC-type uncharacterized transport system ATPase component
MIRHNVSQNMFSATMAITLEPIIQSNSEIRSQDFMTVVGLTDGSGKKNLAIWYFFRSENV